MSAAADTVGVELQPMTNHSPLYCLFFIAFIVIGSFFVMNLIVGVSIDKVGQPCLICAYEFTSCFDLTWA